MNYVKIEIKDVEQIKAAMDNLGRRQLPFALALAATRVAKIVERELYAEMGRVFDRPTRWTMNSLYVKAATRRTLEALVKLKDDAFKGTPATKYLSPQIFGGGRRWKRHERALQQVGILPPGMYCVPGEDARLDAHGNMSKGQVVQILSALRAFGEQGYLANRTASSEKRLKNPPQYFALPEGNGRLPAGIYRRYSRGRRTTIRAVLVFIKAPSYKQRFDFFGVAERVIAYHAKDEFLWALQYAKRTALAQAGVSTV